MNPPVCCGLAVRAWLVVSCLLWGVLFVTGSSRGVLYARSSDVVRSQGQQHSWGRSGRPIEEGDLENSSLQGTRKGMGLLALGGGSEKRRREWSRSVVGFVFVLAAVFLIIQCARLLRHVSGRVERSLAGAERTSLGEACGGFDNDTDTDDIARSSDSMESNVEEAFSEVFRGFSELGDVSRRLFSVLTVPQQIRFADQITRLVVKELAALAVLVDWKFERWMVYEIRRFYSMMKYQSYFFERRHPSCVYLGRLREALAYFSIFRNLDAQRQELRCNTRKQLLCELALQQKISFAECVASFKTLLKRRRVLTEGEVDVVFKGLKVVAHEREQQILNEKGIASLLQADPQARQCCFDADALSRSVSSIPRSTVNVEALIPDISPNRGEQHREAGMTGAPNVLVDGSDSVLPVESPSFPQAGRRKHLGSFNEQQSPGLEDMQLRNRQSSSGTAGPQARSPFCSERMEAVARWVAQHFSGGQAGQYMLPAAQESTQSSESLSDDVEERKWSSEGHPSRTSLRRPPVSLSLGFLQRGDPGGLQPTQPLLGELTSQFQPSTSTGPPPRQPPSHAVEVDSWNLLLQTPIPRVRDLRVAPMHLAVTFSHTTDPASHSPPKHSLENRSAGEAIAGASEGRQLPPLLQSSSATPPPSQSSAGVRLSRAPGAGRPAKRFLGLPEGMPAGRRSDPPAGP